MRDNSWQSEMYDKAFAANTIGSKALAEKAEEEAAFILKILDLPIRAKILDLPCGTGRHSVHFGRRGFEVLGLDISQACLALAKRNSSHKNVSYRCGDMSKLEEFRGEFDALTNLFTSFGYFKDDFENKRVLKKMIRCLKPGGKIVIQTINRNFLLPIFKPAFWSVTDGVTTVQASVYDPVTKYNESYICLVNDRTGAGTARYHRVRLYSPTEMMSLLKECGCVNVKVWGDFYGNALDRKKSTHPIYLGIRR